MGAPDKADIRELVGVSVNSSSLVDRLGESDLDRVAGLGAAALAISTGADIANLPIAAMDPGLYRRSADMRTLMLDPGTPDERDAIAAELGPLLWHIRFGAQWGMIPRAVDLYAAWLRTRRLFATLVDQEHAPLLKRFSTRVLHEYLSDRCQHCGGCGKLERTRHGSWIRPRGSMQRNATFRSCTACFGSGRSRPSDAERRKWLQVEAKAYDEDGWQHRFSAALIWLHQFHVRRVHRPLTAQLERRKKRV